MLDTVCAAVSQSPVERSPNEDSARSEAERLQHVQTTPHAGIEIDFQAVADCLCNGSKSLDT